MKAEDRTDKCVELGNVSGHMLVTAVPQQADGDAALEEKGGFYTKLSSSRMIIIPPRYVVLTMNMSSDTHCFGVRWHLLGSDLTQAQFAYLISNVLGPRRYDATWTE